MIDNLATDISVSVLDKVKDRTGIWRMEFCFHMSAGAGKGAAALSWRLRAKKLAEGRRAPLQMRHTISSYLERTHRYES